MGRPGRKRKQGAREKSGRNQRKLKAELIDERTRVARSQPHRSSLKSNDRVSEMAESPLGRLRLIRVAAERRASSRAAELPGISAGEYATGEAFAGAVSRYRAVIEGPKPVRSLAIATAYDYAATQDEQSAVEKFSCPSAHADPIERELVVMRERVGGRRERVIEKIYAWPCQLAGESCACAERRRRYMRAYEAVAAAGRRALLAVIAVAVRGEELPASELVYLKLGLQAAAGRLGLTDLER